MSNVQKLSVALTPEFMALLEEAVESGEYTSASEVIRDALRHWKEHRAQQDLSTDELRLLPYSQVARSLVKPRVRQ